MTAYRIRGVATGWIVQRRYLPGLWLRVDRGPFGSTDSWPTPGDARSILSLMVREKASEHMLVLRARRERAKRLRCAPHILHLGRRHFRGGKP